MKEVIWLESFRGVERLGEPRAFRIPCSFSLTRQFSLHSCSLPEDVVWAYLTQITLALHDCHSETDLNGKRKPVILHRDIKPENGEIASLSIQALFLLSLIRSLVQ